IFCVSKIFEMALATCGASIIAPSTTVSCASGSIPKLTSSYPAFVDFSSTALIELEPISSPTNCLPFRPPSANISRPLSPSLASKSELPAPRVRLAHLPLHPAVQNRFAKFPSIAEFECRYFAFSDVTVQRIRRDPQILRRLPYVHHFSRFIHEESHPVIRTNTRICNHFWSTPHRATKLPSALREFVIPPRCAQRQGILCRSCPKNGGSFRQLKGIAGMRYYILWYIRYGTATQGTRARHSPVPADGYSFTPNCVPARQINSK